MIDSSIFLDFVFLTGVLGIFFKTPEAISLLPLIVPIHAIPKPKIIIKNVEGPGDVNKVYKPINTMITPIIYIHITNKYLLITSALIFIFKYLVYLNNIFYCFNFSPQNDE